MKRIALLIPLLALSLLQGLRAQQSVLAAGGTATGSGGSLTYSVGQVSFHALTGSTAVVTEGLQQPYEILFMDGIEQEGTIRPEYIIGPNPASTFVRVKITSQGLSGLGYCLYDLQGKLLLQAPVHSAEVILPLENLAPAVYLLEITQHNYPLQIFRIIKNQDR